MSGEQAMHHRFQLLNLLLHHLVVRVRVLKSEEETVHLSVSSFSYHVFTKARSTFSSDRPFTGLRFVVSEQSRKAFFRKTIVIEL